MEGLGVCVWTIPPDRSEHGLRFFYRDHVWKCLRQKLNCPLLKGCTPLRGDLKERLVVSHQAEDAPASLTVDDHARKVAKRNGDSTITVSWAIYVESLVGKRYAGWPHGPIALELPISPTCGEKCDGDPYEQDKGAYPSEVHSTKNCGRAN